MNRAYWRGFSRDWGLTAFNVGDLHGKKIRGESIPGWPVGSAAAIRQAAADKECSDTDGKGFARKKETSCFEVSAAFVTLVVAKFVTRFSLWLRRWLWVLLKC